LRIVAIIAACESKERCHPLSTLLSATLNVPIIALFLAYFSTFVNICKLINPYVKIKIDCGSLLD